MRRQPDGESSIFSDACESSGSFSRTNSVESTIRAGECGSHGEARSAGRPEFENRLLWSIATSHCDWN